MKLNVKSIFFLTLLSGLLFYSCKKETVEVKEVKIEKFVEKKEKRNPDLARKKGIEYMADYQLEIRKHMDSINTSYKMGYLQEEFKKAIENKSFFKRSNSLNPVFTERGPVNVPGRTRGIAVHPTDNKIWYVGTVSGGVWKTEDEGATWVNLTDTQIPNLATSTIVISKNDPSTIYVGTGEPFGNLGAVGGSGIFKSTDGGITWNNLINTSSFGDIGRIIINPNDKNNLIVGSQKGIYRTVDGGTTWSHTYVTQNWVQDLDADPANFNIQYGSVRDFGLVKSTDGGINWQTIFDRNNFNNRHSRFETDVSLADPNTIFVSVYTPSGNASVGVNSDFYVSRNKGATFSRLGFIGTASNANLLTGQGWYDNVIMGHPYDVNSFYVGGVALFKVSISGTNFTSQSIASGYDSSKINTSVHVDQHGLYPILGNNQEFKILLANDGGIYSTSMSQNPGAIQGDWSGDAIGKNSTQFYGATKQNGQNNYLAGAQDNGSWVSLGNDSDRNKEYTFVFGGDGFEVLWHYNNPGDFLVTSQFGRVGRYINYSYVGTANIADSGNNSVSPFYSKISSADNNPNSVFTISTNGVWRSTDFGLNWKLTEINNGFIPSYSSALNVEVSIADPNVVWAGGAMREDGTVSLHVSQDNGQTFTMTNTFDNPKENHSYNISGIGTSMTERSRAYVLFSANGAAKILKTEDLGQTWTDISGYSTTSRTGFPDVAVHSILEMPFDKNIIWVGTDIGIFQTTNGGSNWSLIDGFIPVAVYDMKIVNDQVVISTYGRGIWSATLSELSSYTLPTYLSLPDVTSFQKEFESLQTIVNYNVTDDNVNRIKIFIDDIEQAELTQDFNTGQTYQYETASLTEGVHKFGIQLFDDSSSKQSLLKEHQFEVIDFDNPSQSIGISEFSTSDVYIYNAKFKVDNMSGRVSTNVLNNVDHPYQNSTTYSSILRKPLTITEANKNFTYEDLAIVEPYTDNLNDLNSFYDFVIIEASSDLQTWKTLDKYDSRRFSDWLDEYNKGGNASARDDLFKSQTIVLTDKGFSIGDTIVIRFSLVTDAAAVSFGWAIKSIEGAVASIDEVVKEIKAFTVYPTISNGEFTIFAKNSLGNSKMQIVDINGKLVFKDALDFNKNEKQKISVNLTSGVYIIQIIGENSKRASKKIIIQ